MSVSIEPVAATSVVPPTNVAALAASPDQIRADSVNIATHYGLPPALILASAPVIYHVTNSSDTVTPVAPVVRSSRLEDPTLGRKFDAYA